VSARNCNIRVATGGDLVGRQVVIDRAAHTSMQAWE